MSKKRRDNLEKIKNIRRRLPNKQDSEYRKIAVSATDTRVKSTGKRGQVGPLYFNGPLYATFFAIPTITLTVWGYTEWRKRKVNNMGWSIKGVCSPENKSSVDHNQHRALASFSKNDVYSLEPAITNSKTQKSGWFAQSIGWKSDEGFRDYIHRVTGVYFYKFGEGTIPKGKYTAENQNGVSVRDVAMASAMAVFGCGYPSQNGQNDNEMDVDGWHGGKDHLDGGARDAGATVLHSDAGHQDAGPPECTNFKSLYHDVDNDGYGSLNDSIEVCSSLSSSKYPSGWTDVEGDCNDNAGNINPGAVEDCNDIDDNCNVSIDEGFVCTVPQNIRTHCDPDGDGIITDAFADSNLLNAIRQGLEKGPTDDLTLQDTLNRTSAGLWIGLHGKHIQDLSGLECFANLLYELSLDENQISDLSPLSFLPLVHLRRLSLMRNQISDLSPLASLTSASFTELYLSYNLIQDISPLSSLIHLINIDMDHNQIADLSPLSPLTHLGGLVLHNNQISDLSPLASLVNLSGVTLHENLISDLAPLSALTNMYSLVLNGNQISDLNPLSSLINLHILLLTENQISDINPLISNSGLDHGDDLVGLEGNPQIPSSQIDALRAKGVSVLWP
ncbi:MAG: hypothetical protein Q7T03_10215 [Deltaproteobacteria bacterium]|nr:hypothetical protein [Deltaproteobacteria bacterium]